MKNYLINLYIILLIICITRIKNNYKDNVEEIKNRLERMCKS